MYLSAIPLLCIENALCILDKYLCSEKGKHICLVKMSIIYLFLSVKPIPTNVSTDFKHETDCTNLDLRPFQDARKTKPVVANA